MDRKDSLHHDNFTFGQPVYLSKIYEIVSSIEGVDYLDVTSFTKVGYGKREEPIKYLQQGYISVDEFEIVRLDNDPNFPEHGIISVNLIGGK